MRHYTQPMSPERIIAALVASALLGAGLIAARVAQRRLGSPIDVLPLFLVVWGGALALFATPVIDYGATRAEAWLVIYGSIATTAVGCLAARRLWQERAVPSIGDQASVLRASMGAGRLRLVWFASAALGLAGFVAFVLAVDRVAGWHTVFSDPAAVRLIKRTSVEFQTTYGLWKLLTYFNQVAFIVWTIAIRIGAFGGRWRLLAPSGLISLVPFVYTADRNLLAAALGLACTLHLLWPWGGSWRRVAIALGLAVVLAGGTLTAIGNRYGGSLANQSTVAARVTSPKLDPVAIPYLYITANLPTFGKLTEDGLAPLTTGQMVALPAVKAAAQAGLIENAPVGTGVFYPIPFETFSNYSWLGRFWLDFRAPGVFLLSLLVGFVASLARLRLAGRPTFLTLWTTSILLYVIVYSPLSNVLSTSLTWEYLLLGPIGAVILKPRGGRLVLARLRASPRTAIALAGAAVCMAAALAVAVLTTKRPAPVIVATTELRSEVEKARYTYGQLGRYPTPLGLATRLAVNQPGLTFVPQPTYTEPLPERGVIAVFTTPRDVFLRVRGDDGRLYEVHRTEQDGGATYGPGTRDH